MADLRSGEPPISLYERLAALAQRDRRAVAILAPGRVPLTFGALLDRMDAIRTALNERGLGRGDRIALLAERGPDTAVAVFGIAGCAACVPLNPAAPAHELEQSLTQTQAKALLVPASASAALRDTAHRAAAILLEYSIDDGAPIGELCIEGDRGTATARCGPAASNEPAVIMRTSGTTARAKIVPLSHDTIIAQAAKLRRVFDLTPADRCLNAMPLCYAHGLVTGTIMPIAEGGAVIEPSSFDAETFFACMREFSPTWYTATPTYHQAILDWLEQNPNALADHRLRFMRSGSGALPMRVGQAVERILGAPLLESYATTETGVITCNPPSGLGKPGTVGISPDDDIGIMDDDGKLLAPGMAGEIVVRGAAVFGGYEGDPAANDRAIRDGWYHTSDHGVIDADGYLKVFGRLDDVINRGGEKISPREIDDALLEHEAVVEAVSFAVPHATLNQELAAAVVLRPGAQVTGDELRRSLASRFSPFKVPRIILCVAELPKGPSGKILRAKMADYFDFAAQSVSVAEKQPRSKIQEILLAMWRDVLKRQDIGCDDDFFLSGGDSLSAVDLLHRIENELQHILPITVLIQAPTVRQLEAHLETLGAVDSIVRIHSTGMRRPLFAVGGRFGHVARLLPLMRALDSDQPCYGLQPPGLDWAIAGCTTLPQMATYYIGEIRAIQPCGPYRLLGASFGGLMVFEIALQLQRLGEDVEFLGLVDSPQPTCIVDGKLHASRPFGIEELQSQPADSIIEPHLRVGRAHLSARLDYILDDQSPSSEFRGELTFFYCAGAPVVAQHDDRRLWRFFASKFRLLPVPGIHGEYHREPQFTVLKNLLRDCLNGAPPVGCDPASVFDRIFRIDKHGGRESIVGSGDVYRVQRGRKQGFVDAFPTSGDSMRFLGWAIEPDGQPAQTVAAFLDGRFLGYGASGMARADVAKRLGVPAAQYCGFQFDFRAGVASGRWRLLRLLVLAAVSGKRLRLFVLSTDGRAAELQHRNAAMRFLAFAWLATPRALAKASFILRRRAAWATAAR
jgi:oxalate---CoA ligase